MALTVVEDAYLSKCFSLESIEKLGKSFFPQRQHVVCQMLIQLIHHCQH